MTIAPNTRALQDLRGSRAGKISCDSLQIPALIRDSEQTHEWLLKVPFRACWVMGAGLGSPAVQGHCAEGCLITRNLLGVYLFPPQVAKKNYSAQRWWLLSALKPRKSISLLSLAVLSILPCISPGNRMSSVAKQICQRFFSFVFCPLELTLSKWSWRQSCVAPLQFDFVLWFSDGFLYLAFLSRN